MKETIENIDMLEEIEINKSPKTKRRRNFTKIRSPYKDYGVATWTWTIIFKEIELLKKNKVRGFVEQTAKKYGIIKSTLEKRWSAYKAHPEKDFDKENRGGSNKVLTESLEIQIARTIKVDYIKKHIHCDNYTIKYLALKMQEANFKDKDFTASDGWVSNFKKTYKISTVRVSKSRKATKIITAEEIHAFKTECIEALISVGPENVYNTDETKWNNINAAATTLTMPGETPKI